MISANGNHDKAAKSGDPEAWRMSSQHIECLLTSAVYSTVANSSAAGAFLDANELKL